MSGDPLMKLISPSTGQVISSIVAQCRAGASSAIDLARAAFNDRRWGGLSSSARGDILLRLADLIEEKAGSLNALDAEDMGKPIGLQFGDARAAAEYLRNSVYAAQFALGDLFDSGGDCLAMQRLTPRGVVVAITPWNFPTMNAVLKLAPALASGNSLILKPSEYAPRSALRLAELALIAGMPEGVFQVVVGQGSEVGKALALSASVDMISFTGSTTVGGLLMQYAGQSNLKSVQLECGGKSPHVVFPDFEDLDVVASVVADLILINQGQLCVAGSRLLVHKDIEDALVKRVLERLGAVSVGDAMSDTTDFGPLASERQLMRVMGYIEDATTEGCMLRHGGERILKESGGFFVAPTVFSNVPAVSRIAQEEIFGPVLAVSSFETEEEAIELANATQYGLSAHVWTHDARIGHRTAKRIRAGRVNLHNAAPNGGGGAGFAVSVEPYGQSGVGVDGGLRGLEAYMQRQTIIVEH